MGLVAAGASLAAQTYGAYRLGKTVMKSMSPKAPAIPAAPPAAAPVTKANATVANAGNNAKMKAAAGASAGGTNPTGGQGLVNPPNTTKSVLLG